MYAGKQWSVIEAFCQIQGWYRSIPESAFFHLETQSTYEFIRQRRRHSVS